MSTVKKILIGGERRAASEDFTVRNPYTGEVLAEVFAAGPEDNEEAVALAEWAAREMRELSRGELAAGLRRMAEGIAGRRAEFAATIAAEAAKPLRLARAEVERAVAAFGWAAGEAERFTGRVVPVDVVPGGRGKSALTRMVPRGVVYGITPFNFPLNLVGHKVAPALASGNAVIIKPSRRTPLTALLLGEVFLDSGLPKSALQIVPTETHHLEPIYADERVRMISFTGSAEVGWQIRRKAPKKMVTLELGGSAPVIVDESADLERSLRQTAAGAFAYAGQVCISVQRVYVHERLFDEWTEKFVAAARGLKIGDPLDETTELSVLIDEEGAKKAQNWINEAALNGAEVLCGNTRDGALLEATVLTGTNPEMRVVAEEIFAPVAVVERFADFGEAVDLANNTRYGLQAGVFTNDLKNVRYAAEHLEFGGVIVNDAPTFRVDNMPYGGVKDSGFGREGIRWAMEEMCEPRLVVIDS